MSMRSKLSNIICVMFMFDMNVRSPMRLMTVLLLIYPNETR